MSAKAAATRLNILQKAFELIYKNGYRTTSVDEIIATTQVTKGAFFYHFKSKDEMGLAMINEVMSPGMQEALIGPLSNSEDAITEIYSMMHSLLMETPFFIVKYGCPAVNLVEEMASQSEVFKSALTKLNSQWHTAIAASLEKGKTLGKNIAKIQRQPPGQGLQTEHAKQFCDAWISLDELSGLDIDIELPAHGGVVQTKG